MEVTSSSTRLGCGRDIDDVWERMDAPPDDHERSCPFCRTARQDLTQLSTATRELRDAELADADLQADPALTERILTIARSEVRRGRRLPLDRPDPGRPDDLTVSEQAVVSVIRRVGDATDVVEIRRCAVDLDTQRGLSDLVHDQQAGADDPVTAPEAEGSAARESLPTGEPAQVRVSLRVGIDARVAIPVVIDTLRSSIIEVVEHEVGMEVVRVDVTVEDVINV